MLSLAKEIGRGKVSLVSYSAQGVVPFSRPYPLSRQRTRQSWNTLGVAAGIKSWCKKFGERHGMQIDFKSNVSSVLPLEKLECPYFEFYRKPCTTLSSTAE